MNKFIKAISLTFILSAVFAVCASADTSETQKEENISFNYGDNTFTITDDSSVREGQLTVILVKGDYEENNSVPTLTSEDVFYIGQAEGSSYAEIVQNVGIKTEGLVPGEYTLITSGEGGIESKTKVVIGSTDSEYVPTEWSATYGTVTQSIRVYNSEDTSKYVYVSVSEINLNGSAENFGFLLQRKKGEDVEKAHKLLKDLNLGGSLENIAFITGRLEIGFQLNGVDAQYDVVAIPYCKNN